MYKDSKFMKSQLCCYLKKVGFFYRNLSILRKIQPHKMFNSALCDLRPSLRNQGILSFTSEILTRLMQYTRGLGPRSFHFIVIC